MERSYCGTEVKGGNGRSCRRTRLDGQIATLNSGGAKSGKKWTSFMAKRSWWLQAHVNCPVASAGDPSILLNVTCVFESHLQALSKRLVVRGRDSIGFDFNE
jgi:hypothetical protein